MHCVRDAGSHHQLQTMPRTLLRVAEAMHHSLRRCTPVGNAASRGTAAPLASAHQARVSAHPDPAQQQRHAAATAWAALPLAADTLNSPAEACASTAGHTASDGFSAISRTSITSEAPTESHGAAGLSSAAASPGVSSPSSISHRELRDRARTEGSHASEAANEADAGGLLGDTNAPHTPVLLREVLSTKSKCRGIR